MLGLLRRFPLISFFVIALVISWIVVLIHVLPEPDIPTTALTIVGITAGPFLAGFIMQAVINGRRGVLHLLKRMIRGKVHPLWYVVVLLGIPAALVLGTLATPGALEGMNWAAPDWVSYLWTFPLVMFVGGPFLEEPGWRGFAVPRLEAKFGYWGPLLGTLILGVVWALWHFPQYMMPSWAAQNGGFNPPAMIVYVLSVLPITIILTWVYNRTRGSLLMTVLAHTSINAFYLINAAIFPVAADAVVNGFIGFGGASLLLIIFTKGRLGFDHYLREVPADERALDGSADAVIPARASRS